MVSNSINRPSVLDLKIVYELFANRKGSTISDLANRLKVDYKNTHNAVNKLFDIGIIKKEKIGNYNICKLNYSNEDIIEYLKEHNFYMKIKGFKKRHSDEYRILMDTIKRIIHRGFIKHIIYGDLVNELLVCLLFGSYTRSEEKKDSDLDILFISRVEGSVGYKKELNTTNLPYQKKFHVTEQGMSSFMEDLKNKKKLSIATELEKQPPIIFYGDDIFFRIMIEHGNLE